MINFEDETIVPYPLDPGNVQDVTKVTLGSELIDYDTERDSVVARDPILPDGQNVVLFSYIDGRHDVLRIHGCFPDTEAAIKWSKKLTLTQREKCLAVPANSGTFDSGVWIAWPPRPEYFQDATKKEQERVVDFALREHCKARIRQRRHFVESLEDQGVDVSTLLSTRDQNLMDNAK